MTCKLCKGSRCDPVSGDTCPRCCDASGKVDPSLDTEVPDALARSYAVPTVFPPEGAERPFQQRLGDDAVLRTYRFEVLELAHPFHRAKAVSAKGAGVYVRSQVEYCERCRESAAALDLALKRVVAQTRPKTAIDDS